MSACEREESEVIRLGITPALTLTAGTELALTVREHLPQVLLSIVEAMSHVLVDTLSRGEVDFILCYDIPDLPHLSRAVREATVRTVSPASGMAKLSSRTSTKATGSPLRGPGKCHQHQIILQQRGTRQIGGSGMS